MNYIDYTSPYSHNVTLNSGNKPPYTLVQCPRTQWIFFPEKGFPAGFTLERFIRGGECHRPFYLVG